MAARARAGQVALPELDGALEPIVFAGRDSNTGKSHSLPDRIDTLCSRAINWAKCACASIRSRHTNAMLVSGHMISDMLHFFTYHEAKSLRFETRQ